MLGVLESKQRQDVASTHHPQVLPQSCVSSCDSLPQVLQLCSSAAATAPSPEARIASRAQRCWLFMLCTH